ncbi:unnamed protein product [Peronospora belbahrii]|uniref:Uncharacterized protein n=1 Tax=Peronospora belbahrii TaxID=622444 RepID=A0ABN8CM96_9STRA|nr:unnamed protein product [Peronospora belbahrii]
MASRSRRAVLSLTTRFCFPHQGMKTLAYFSSGSAVLLRNAYSKNQGIDLAVVTCQHLLAVNGEKSTADKREVLLKLPLASPVKTHESRDLALLTWLLSRIGKLPETSHRRVKSDQTDGYKISKNVAGHFVGRSTSGQSFAWSQELLEEGMCGGAVVGVTTGECVGIVEGIVPVAVESEKPPIQDRKESATWQMRKSLAGHVAFIPSSDVSQRTF